MSRSSDEAAVRSLLWRLNRAGLKPLAVNDGMETIHLTGHQSPHKVNKLALDAILSVDEARLYVSVPGRNKPAWLWLVLGNEPSELVCDHVDISPLTEVCEQFSNYWE